jgi:hypothetical protein
VRHGALTVEHQPAGGLGLDHHRVEGPVDRASGWSSGTSAGYTRADNRCLPYPGEPLADGQQLDVAAQCLGRGEVLGADLCDALAVDVVGGDPGVEGDGGQDRGLGRAS